MKHPILLIDGLNVFMRAYAANPHMSPKGYYVGGVIGSLKMIRTVCNRFSPSKVVIVWEGGGSQRRRAIFPQYKNSRKPSKINNRFYGEDLPDTPENKADQISILINLLRNLPINQIYVDNVEADDVIGYLCKYKFKDQEKVIVSSDQDYYQLLNDTTNIWRLGKSCIVKAEDVLNDTGIHVNNFALAKAISGDKSDNIDGIKGAGYKTLTKRFPEFISEKSLDLNDLFSLASARNTGKIKVYNSIVDNFDIVARNWKLVYLSMNNMAANQVDKVNNMIDTFEPARNKMKLMRGLIAEGTNDFDVAGLFLSLVYIKD